MLPNGTGGYLLDGFGGLHAFATGNNVMPPAVTISGYWPDWDIARGVAILPDGTAGYVLDGYGGMHPFAIGANPAAAVPAGGPYWDGWDIARGITIPYEFGDAGGYVLDGFGGLHTFGTITLQRTGATPHTFTVPTPIGGPYWNGWDIARGVTSFFSGFGGVTVDAWGGLHPHAAAGID
jgi:hypothetical protein